MENLASSLIYGIKKVRFAEIAGIIPSIVSTVVTNARCADDDEASSSKQNVSWMSGEYVSLTKTDLHGCHYPSRCYLLPSYLSLEPYFRKQNQV